MHRLTNYNLTNHILIILTIWSTYELTVNTLTYNKCVIMPSDSLEYHEKDILGIVHGWITQQLPLIPYRWQF